MQPFISSQNLTDKRNQAENSNKLNEQKSFTWKAAEA
jgi:hypothetical protein